MSGVLLRAMAAWFLLVVAAIANGVLRESLLNAALGERVALPVSGLLLGALIFLVALGTVPFLRANSAVQLWLAGGLWVLLTLLFEFGFGHWVTGKSWAELRAVFNPLTGNLMLVALLVAGVSPYAVGRLRGLL